MSYSKTELIETYKNLDIVAPDNIADSVLLSATKQTPANLSTKVPPTGQLNSHLKKRVSNNQKKQKTPSKPDWDNHSGWASRFKKSDDLFNKRPTKESITSPNPTGLNNRHKKPPLEKEDSTAPVSSVLGSLALDADDELPAQLKNKLAPELPSSTPMSRVASSQGQHQATDWVYRDPSGNVQGPFKADLMQEWFLGSYFPSDLLVRRVDRDNFTPLQELLASVQDKSAPFHSAPLPAAPPALNVNALNQRFNASPVVSNASPAVDLLSPQATQSPLAGRLQQEGLYHPQPQVQRLANWDSRTSSPAASPFGRPLWGPNSPGVDVPDQHSREEFLMALRHRELLEQQAAQAQFIQQQMLQQQQQQQQHQEQLHHELELQRAWELQQQAQAEAQKQAQEQLDNTQTKDEADISVQVEAPESTIASVTEDGVMSPMKTPEPIPAVPTPQPSQKTVRGGVNVISQAELERVQRMSKQEGPVGKMGVSLSDVIDKQQQQHEEGEFAQPKKAAPAPWAPQEQGEKATAAPSLKEIQEAEARQSQARKQAQQAQRAAISQSQNASARIDDIVPGTLNWGLAGSAPQAAPAPQPTGPAWGGSNLNQKKTLRQIQEEEEAREREAQRKKMVASAQAASATRGYAASAQRTTAPSAGGAWTVVGQSNGAKPAPTAPAPAPVPAAPKQTTKPAQVPKPAPAVSVPPSIAQGGNVREPGAPSEEFIKWCKGALVGLNGTTPDELLPILLSFDIEKPDLELIQDMIYASSSTMDGRRFAGEFAKKRKEDSKGVSLSSAADIVKQQQAPKTLQETFKVVQKKKKRN
ncbi:hypothetical protein E3Q13_02614 [Wallemia mellicola]|uniref:GYF domain-containing protein n=1 Tax=Wallemia mellicola TaxID=1708541 RepID=A0AB38MXF4_9BASI|nr:hypothetical protein E3Q13_02614 [Wallemia mellicola]TIC64978.1 hypothetical protein E3Q02_02407 [Wallemia mellicola]